VTESWNKHLADMPRLNAQYQHNLEVWKSRFSEEDRKAFAAGKTPPGAPLEPQGAGSRAEPSALWNGMIVPVAPYTVRGVLWYQGENNANSADAFVYRSLFTAMIRSWRSTWGEGDLPFIYVQLSRYKYGSNYAVLRESQAQALALPHTAMVVSVDAGMIEDVHYPDKAPVGHRLFPAADRLVYGSRNPAEGPKLSKVEAKQDALLLTFTSTEGGLKLSAPGIPRYAQLMPDTPPADQADGKAVVYRQPSECLARRCASGRSLERRWTARIPVSRIHSSLRASQLPRQQPAQVKAIIASC
jgi:sialate O-acetylesterase